MVFPFFYRYKNYLLFVLYILISISFIISRSDKINVNVKAAVNNSILPLQKLVYNTSESTKNFWNSIEEVKKLKREITTVREQLERLKEASIEIEELKKENDRLRYFLENKKKLDYNSVYAEIIGRDPSNYYSTFFINKGKSDGIIINMPVVSYQGNQKGVVGKIVEVSSHYAKVLPITGIGSYIGAMLYDTRDAGILKGLGKDVEYINLEYISKNAIVNFGDIVITSGQDGVFPQGINIGRVVGVEKVKYGLFYKEIRVKPIIDFSSLEVVYVLLKNPDTHIIQYYKE